MFACCLLFFVFACCLLLFVFILGGCGRVLGSRLEGDAMLTLAIYIFNVLLSFLASTFNR